MPFCASATFLTQPGFLRPSYCLAEFGVQTPVTRILALAKAGSTLLIGLNRPVCQVLLGRTTCTSSDAAEDPGGADWVRQSRGQLSACWAQGLRLLLRGRAGLWFWTLRNNLYILPRNQKTTKKPVQSKCLARFLFALQHTRINKINNLNPQVQIRCLEIRNQLRNVAGYP